MRVFKLQYNIQTPKLNMPNPRAGLSAGSTAPSRFTANTKGQVMFGLTPEMKNVPIFPAGSYNKAQPYTYQEVQPEKVKMSFMEKLGMALAGVGVAVGLVGAAKAIGGLFKSKKSKESKETKESKNDAPKMEAKKSTKTDVKTEVKDDSSTKPTAKFSNLVLSNNVRDIEQVLEAQKDIKHMNTLLNKANTDKIGTLETANKDLDALITSASNQVQDLPCDIVQCKLKIEQFPAEAQYSTLLTQLEKQLAEAESTLATKIEEKTKNSTLITRLTNENVDLEASNSNAQGIIDDLSKELEKIKNSEDYKNLPDDEKASDPNKEHNGNPLNSQKLAFDEDGHPRSFTKSDDSTFKVLNPFSSHPAIVENKPEISITSSFLQKDISSPVFNKQ